MHLHFQFTDHSSHVGGHWHKGPVTHFELERLEVQHAIKMVQAYQGLWSWSGAHLQDSGSCCGHLLNQELVNEQTRIGVGLAARSCWQLQYPTLGQICIAAACICLLGEEAVRYNLRCISCQQTGAAEDSQDTGVQEIFGTSTAR